MVNGMAMVKEKRYLKEYSLIKANSKTVVLF